MSASGRAVTKIWNLSGSSVDLFASISRISLRNISLPQLFKASMTTTVGVEVLIFREGAKMSFLNCVERSGVMGRC